MEQILAVTPILRGQKSNEKHVIPPRQSREASLSGPPAATSHPAPQPTQNHHDDLIDFGQNEAQQKTPQVVVQQAAEYSTQSKSQIPHLPSDLHAAQNQNGGQSQKEMEQVLASTSIA